MIDRPKFAIYLLHFDRPIGRSQHYVGITKADRLPERLKEHSRRQGASLTSRALAAGAEISVARVYWTDDPREERRIKRAGHLSARCPLCSDQVDMFAETVEFPTPARQASPHDWQPHHWPGRP